MTRCNGRGAGGDHCCYIDGKTCEFLSHSDPRRPLCSKWDTMGDAEWQNAPVGIWFANTHPGYTCHDWPQNIPEVMDAEPDHGPFFACCWGRGNR